MPDFVELETRDLRLVAANERLLQADLAHASRHPEDASLDSVLEELLDARLPTKWPPQFYEADDIERALVVAKAGEQAWGLWYVVVKGSLLPDRGDDVIAGIAGFGGPPDKHGNVTLGYSIAPEWRRRGYATQAALALIDLAFLDDRTRSVSAETFAELTPSIRVLEKCGFRETGVAATPGAIRFARFK